MGHRSDNGVRGPRRWWAADESARAAGQRSNRRRLNTLAEPISLPPRAGTAGAVSVPGRFSGRETAMSRAHVLVALAVTAAVVAVPYRARPAVPRPAVGEAR